MGHIADKANELLTVHRGEGPDGTVILRIEFEFMGSTEWYMWDGTPSIALAIADEVGTRHGRDVEREQAEGPTGWEPEFDDEREAVPDELRPCRAGGTRSSIGIETLAA